MAPLFASSSAVARRGSSSIRSLLPLTLRAQPSSSQQYRPASTIADAASDGGHTSTSTTEGTSDRSVHPSNPSGSSRPLPPLYTQKRGRELLEDPVYNYGAAHSRQEREELRLGPYLPHSVHDLSTQVERAYSQLKRRQPHPHSRGPTEQEGKLSSEAESEAAINQYTFLRSLKDQNQILFYALLEKSLRETLKIIYTPTVGESISNYSHLFRRPDGIFLSYPDWKSTVDAAGSDSQARKEAGDAYMRDALTHFGDLSREHVDLVVVTDSEGILGIGDQGVGGINICIGKGAIYTLGGGIDPNRTLSVVLDVGTNNKKLLEDPLYLGWRQERIRGEEYDAFVDSYVTTAAASFSDALLHFEDFGNANAGRLLEKYRDKFSVFNDDRQGTGAVVLAATMSVCKIKSEKLSDQRFVIYGAGTAGMGIASQLRDAMCLQEGLSKEEANKRFYLVDRDGLLVKGLTELRAGQEVYAREQEEVAGWKRSTSEGGDKKHFSLLDAVAGAKPTVLIGVSGQTGAFNEAVVREMSKHTDRPAIFPLSNPSKLCEGHPNDINQWSKGKALMATGSPFDPVDIPGKEGSSRKYIVAESNNAMIYPGLAAGVIVSKATRLSDELIVAGVEALANLSPALKNPDDALLPDLHDVRNISMKVAAAVARAAQKEGLAQRKDLPEDLDALEELIRHDAWEPRYRTIKPI